MTDRYGNRRVPKMLAQVNAHRAAVASEGTQLIQDTCDKIEEHIDFAYKQNAAPAVPDDVAGLIREARTGDVTGHGLFGRLADTIEAQAAELARLRTITDDMVERATLELLGHKEDRAPGVDWECSRTWRISEVRSNMRHALRAALSHPDKEPKA